MVERNWLHDVFLKCWDLDILDVIKVALVGGSLDDLEMTCDVGPKLARLVSNRLVFMADNCIWRCMAGCIRPEKGMSQARQEVCSILVPYRAD